jgi:DNA-directed RNA polymerase specialized sigma24 family protein
VAALERQRRDAQITKQRDARARARERRLDRLFSISADPLISFSKLHERPRADDKVAYPLSTAFATHLDRVRSGHERMRERERRLFAGEPSALLRARQELQRTHPDLSLVFEMTTLGGVSQSALARMLGTTQGCVSKRVARALVLLEEWVHLVHCG